MNHPSEQEPAAGKPDRGRPDPWVTAHAGLVPAGATVLDVACGRGRHAAFFAERGHVVHAVDIHLGDLADLAATGRVVPVLADLEGGPWPFADGSYGGIVVTNYLWRPLLPRVVAAVGAGGALLYATFAVGQERFGRPSNPDFLLRPGELLDAVAGALEVRAYVHGERDGAVRQAIAAVRPA